MEEERLLERLRAMERDPSRRGGLSSVRQISSILGHLEALLNTRQGSTPIAEDFGVPDFTNLTGAFGPDSPREMEQAIKNVIQKYEPRLTRVKVTYLPREQGDLALSFEISARLSSEKDVPVVFNTVISGDGKINVSD